MTPTPVGMRCPECSRERTRVTRGVRSGPALPRATQALIVINVIVFLVETGAGAPLGGGGGGSVWYHGALYGPALTAHNFNPFYTGTHEYWRLLTGPFLHDGLIHIAINMVSLYFVGSALEPAIGSRNFVVVYLTSLLAGSFGALLGCGEQAAGDEHVHPSADDRCAIGLTLEAGEGRPRLGPQSRAVAV